MVKWTPSGGSISEKIAQEQGKLGHQPVLFMFDQRILDNVGVLFSCALYGRLFPILKQLPERPTAARPKLVHWNPAADLMSSILTYLENEISSMSISRLHAQSDCLRRRAARR